MRRPHSSTTRRTVTFRGRAHSTIKSLYAAACAARDGPNDAFEQSLPALLSLLCASNELPSDPTRTLRLRRVPSLTHHRHYFHLVADMSDGTTSSELSLKKACRSALTTPS